MSGRIAVVGSLNLDRTLVVHRLPQPGETVHATDSLESPGGKGANQAAAAARLGGDVGLIGAVADDAAGHTLREAATAAGVDVTRVGTLPGRTGHATILVDEEAENVIIVDSGVNLDVTPEQVRASFGAPDVVVTCFEMSDPVVQATAEASSAAGAVLVLNPSPFRDVPEGLLAMVDVLVVNEHELAGLGGDAEGTDDALRQDRDRLGSGVLVVTRGARGALVVQGDEVVRVPAVPVKAVDTSGCGDAFLGALASRIAAEDSVVEAVRFAVTVGAFAATRAGTQASYPDAAELEAWLAGR